MPQKLTNEEKNQRAENILKDLICRHGIEQATIIAEKILEKAKAKKAYLETVSEFRGVENVAKLNSKTSLDTR